MDPETKAEPTLAAADRDAIRERIKAMRPGERVHIEAETGFRMTAGLPGPEPDIAAGQSHGSDAPASAEEPPDRHSWLD